MLLPNCTFYGKKKSTFIKNQELYNFNYVSNDKFKIFNKFLLTGDKFIPEFHLKQPRFTYSACTAFTKRPERIQQFKETGHIKPLYRK